MTTAHTSTQRSTGAATPPAAPPAPVLTHQEPAPALVQHDAPQQQAEQRRGGLDPAAGDGCRGQARSLAQPPEELQQREPPPGVAALHLQLDLQQHSTGEGADVRWVQSSCQPCQQCQQSSPAATTPAVPPHQQCQQPSPAATTSWASSGPCQTCPCGHVAWAACCCWHQRALCRWCHWQRSQQACWSSPRAMDSQPRC